MTKVVANSPLSSVFQVHGVVVSDIMCCLRTDDGGVSFVYNKKQTPKKPQSEIP